MTATKPAGPAADPAAGLPPLASLPVVLPESWEERADQLEGLMVLLATARAGVAELYAAAYLGAEGTDAARTQAAKLATAGDQLNVERIAARLAAYKLLIDIERGKVTGDE